MSENSIPGESCACAGPILAVDKEHDKCGKMTCFVEELTVSPGASWQSSSEILRSAQRGHLWRLRWAEDRSLQLTPLPAACRRPPGLGSPMAFPAVSASAEKGPRSEICPVWQERLCASDRRFLALALMRCRLGSFQLLA